MKLLLKLILLFISFNACSQNTLDFMRPKNGFNDWMDEANFQSDNAANFTLASGKVTQWNDLSPKARHAIQNTTAAKPTYNSGIINFDGTDDILVMSSEILLSNFTVFVVSKNNAPLENRPLWGSSVNDYFYYSGDARRWGIYNQNTLSTTHMYGGSDYMHVMCIRRSGTTFSVKTNDRVGIQVNSNANANANRISRIGGRIGGFFKGDIRAFCVSSAYLTDAQVSEFTEYLYAKYSIPTNSDVGLIGFGDSITFGQGASISTNNYLNQLALSLNLPPINCGISSSRVSGASSINAIQRYQTQVASRNYKDKIVILYGTNDIQAGTSSTVVEADLNTIISYFKSLGYPADNIIIGSVPYQQGGNNASTLNTFRTMIQGVATAQGIKYADILQAMRDGGGDSLMADQLHPNNSGHAVIASTFFAAAGW